MFLSFTEEQIDFFRSSRFPTQEEFEIKNCIFKNSGSDTIADFYLQIKDSARNSKVYKNIKNKNILKLKIFEIISPEMRAEVQNIKNILDLEPIIKKYGVLQNNIFPCVEYTGASGDKDIILSYKSTLKFPEEEIKFLSIGIIFYIDLQEYVKETNVSEKYVNKDLLSSPLKLYDLFDANGKISGNASTFLQDLRTVKRVFKNKEVLQRLNEKINYDFRLTKSLSQKQKKIVDESYFSDAFFSRDTLGNLNLMFYMDYEKLVQNNSSFKEIVKREDFRYDLLNNCKISSIKIVRREVEVDNIGRIYVKRQPVETIVSSTQKGELVNYIKNENIGSIGELAGFSDLYRFFEVVDKTVYKKKNSLFEYGVEVVVNDGLPNYLKDIKEKLQKNLKIFKEYLNETNNFIKPKTNASSQSGIGYYDPISQNFNELFIDSIFPLKYEKQLTNSLTYFINALKVFDILAIPEEPLNTNSVSKQKSEDFTSERANKIFRGRRNLPARFKKARQIQEAACKNDKTVETTVFTEQKFDKPQEEDFLTPILALLSPRSCTIETITYFIAIYERLLLQIERLLKDNYNTVIQTEKWFKNKVVDSSESPAVGYGFFEVKNYEGFYVVGDTLFSRKINSDKSLYYNDGKVNQEYSNYLHSYVAPSYIFSKNKQIVLDSTVPFPTNDDFVELEIDIRRNSLSDSPEKNLLSDDKVDVVFPSTFTAKLLPPTITGELVQPEPIDLIDFILDQQAVVTPYIEQLPSNLIGSLNIPSLTNNTNSPVGSLVQNLFGNNSSQVQTQGFNLVTLTPQATVLTSQSQNQTQNYGLFGGVIQQAMNAFKNASENKTTYSQPQKNSKIPDSVIKKHTHSRTEAVLNKFNFNVENLFKEKFDESNVLKNAAKSSEQEADPEVNPELLYLGMLKSTSRGKYSYKTQQINVVAGVAFTIPLALPTGDNRIPYQTYSIIEDKNRFFPNFTNDAVNDIITNSKFLFLFNAIQKIQVLNIGKNVKDSTWVTLTSEEYNKIPVEDKKICRLVTYQYPPLGFNFEDISLPIYDEYFILNKINISLNDVSALFKKFQKSSPINSILTKSKIFFDIGKKFAPKLQNNFTVPQARSDEPAAQVGKAGKYRGRRAPINQKIKKKENITPFVVIPQEKLKITPQISALPIGTIEEIRKAAEEIAKKLAIQNTLENTQDPCDPKEKPLINLEPDPVVYNNILDDLIKNYKINPDYSISADIVNPNISEAVKNAIQKEQIPVTNPVIDAISLPKPVPTLVSNNILNNNVLKNVNTNLNLTQNLINLNLIETPQINNPIVDIFMGSKNNKPK